MSDQLYQREPISVRLSTHEEWAWNEAKENGIIVDNAIDSVKRTAIDGLVRKGFLRYDENGSPAVWIFDPPYDYVSTKHGPQKRMLLIPMTFED